MQFAKNFPDELRLQITTSDVVSKRVALKKKGKDHSGLCPFHNEKTPSFTVNDQKGFFHCFGCGAHGDIIGFTMQSEGLGFGEAVIKLAGDYNIHIPQVRNRQQDNQEQDLITRQYSLLEEVCQLFEGNLFSQGSSSALSYLYGRGLSNQNIKKFRLGFAPEGYESLLNHLKSKGFSESEMLGSGVIAKSNNGKLYDKFRGRIIFPITNLKGKIIAFGGRIMGDGQPKYLNSSETILFKKGQNLYNFSGARKSIYDKKSAIIVEGYMDVISLAMSGIENVVAPLGTAVTLDQMAILSRTTNDIVLCLDGDMAGKNAMRRVVNLILPQINSKSLIRFALLPNGVDPDDFVKKNGRAAMENFLRDADSLSKVLFDFEAAELNINSHQEDLVSPEKKTMLEASLMAKVELIADANSKKHFGQYYRNLLFELGRKKKFASKPKNVKPKIISHLEFNKQDKYALAIISIIANFPDLKDYQDDMCILRNLDFKNHELSNIKESLMNFIDNNEGLKLAEIKEYLNKLISNQNLKQEILSYKFSNQNLENITLRLKIFLMKYFYEEVSEQFSQILTLGNEIETDEKVLKDGKQKELFNYKTYLEKKIIQLESDLI
ncbi:MAG: DNA primase [Lentimonas sp.]|jgi:DNA primase